MEIVYRKALGQSLVNFQNEFYIYYKGKAFKVNEVGARIFDLCDGMNSIEKISSKIGRIYNIEQEIIREDCLYFLNLLIDKGLVKKSNN